METVKRAANCQVECEHYRSKQVGKAKDLLALTVSGVIDIGSVMPSYASEKMPLSAVAELPGGFASSCEGTLAYWALARDRMLARNEYPPNGIRVLFTLVSVPYQMLMKQKADTVKALEGRKLRSTGASTGIAIRKLNAVPIRMAAPEVTCAHTLHQSTRRLLAWRDAEAAGHAAGRGLSPPGSAGRLDRADGGHRALTRVNEGGLSR